MLKNNGIWLQHWGEKPLRMHPLEKEVPKTQVIVDDNRCSDRSEIDIKPEHFEKILHYIIPATAGEFQNVRNKEKRFKVMIRENR